MTPERPTTEYLVDLRSAAPAVAEQACRLLVDLLAPRATTMWVDAFSDAADLPATAERAWAALLRRRPTGMGIELDPQDETDRRLLHDFAFWSIHVEAHVRTTVIGSISDSGDSLWFAGDAEDASRFHALGVRVEELSSRVPRRRRWRRHSFGSRPSG